MAVGVKVKSSGADIEVKASTVALIAAGAALVGGGFLVLNRWLSPPPPPAVYVLAPPGFQPGQAARVEPTPFPAPATSGTRIRVGYVPVTRRVPARPRFILSGF